MTDSAAPPEAGQLPPDYQPDPMTSSACTCSAWIHYCLGAPLARLEGEVAFRALLTRFPALALAVPESSLRWRLSSLIHGLESLPVSVGWPVCSRPGSLLGGLAARFLLLSHRRG